MIKALYIPVSQTGNGVCFHETFSTLIKTPMYWNAHLLFISYTKYKLCNVSRITFEKQNKNKTVHEGHMFTNKYVCHWLSSISAVSHSFFVIKHFRVGQFAFRNRSDCQLVKSKTNCVTLFMLTSKTIVCELGLGTLFFVFFLVRTRYNIKNCYWKTIIWQQNSYTNLFMVDHETSSINIRQSPSTPHFWWNPLPKGLNSRGKYCPFVTKCQILVYTGTICSTPSLYLSCKSGHYTTGLLSWFTKQPGSQWYCMIYVKDLLFFMS